MTEYPAKGRFAQGSDGGWEAAGADTHPGGVETNAKSSLQHGEIGSEVVHRVRRAIQVVAPILQDGDAGFAVLG